MNPLTSTYLHNSMVGRLRPPLIRTISEVTARSYLNRFSPSLSRLEWIFSIMTTPRSYRISGRSDPNANDLAKVVKSK